MASEGDRASRPNSLLLDGVPPEKEPLKFDVQLVGAPPEVEQLVNNIKQVAEDFLYHWKTFPIVLPPSRFTGPGALPSDIIVAPPCDELDAAALDAGMEPHPLSPKQLHSIREKGEFEVPSRHFPGLVHVWRVSGWLQRGRERARADLYTQVAYAAALVVVVARDRLLRERPFSVLAGVRSVLDGLHRLMDLLIGMPSLEARDLDKTIREERSRYLVAELICKPEHQEDISVLAAWVSRALRRAAAEKPPRAPCGPRDPCAPRAAPVVPHVPCVYTTPQQLQIDLRLYRRETVRAAAPTLQALLERESRGWFLHYRERLAHQLAAENLPAKDIEHELRSRGLREYSRRVCSALAGEDGAGERGEEGAGERGREESARRALSALHEQLPPLLRDQLLATTILTRAEEGVRQKLETRLATAEARLRTTHPVLSRAPAWHNEQMTKAADRFSAELRWAAMEDAAAAMQAHNLHQHRYFLLRDLVFLRDREPLLIKELRAAETPTRSFSWSSRIWLPHNWIVTRHFRGRSERIPAVLSARATSIVTPRSDPSQPVFLVDKERVRTTTTRWPGWRIVNLVYRSWCWMCNLTYLLGVFVPWCSPLSLRTLLCREPFLPDWELSQVNGTLFPRRSSETQTVWSRLLALYRRVSKERTRFETEPDTGLLGKGLSRQANRVWNYGVVAVLGSLALLVLYPACACAVSVCALLAALTVPLWVPLGTLALHAAAALLYDLDCPDPKRLNRWFVLVEVLIWRIGILGILQSVAALVTAVVICPVCAILILVGSSSWWGVRGAWERIVFRALIVRSARVPAHDSAFCARVPASRDHQVYYQITPAQALAAVCARAEVEALTVWTQSIEAAIEKPLRDYRHFVEACFGPFSVQIARTGSYKQVEKECASLTSSAREKATARRRQLALSLTDAVRARIRLTATDLRTALQACARQLSVVCATDGEWWSARGLASGDWHALAANMLVEVFDGEILVGLKECTARVSLGGGDSDACALWGALCAGDAPPDVLARAGRDVWHDDTESPRWWSPALPRVPAPSLDVNAFNPRAAVHPPLPAVPAVALVLYNREAETPVPLESELCSDILRTLEDAPDCDDRRGVERYRGGGSDSSAGSDDDVSHASLPAAELEPTSRASVRTERAACRWTLTGRGVRLRADLASPEDVTLDAERASVGTSV